MLLLGFALLTKGPAWSWTLQLAPTSSFPPVFLAIDKSRQQLYLMKQHSPLQVNREIKCSTGKATGDKFKEGDLRTPEGVYFLEHKRTSGLNYALYGDIAFPLNFPNPIDRIRGKTGDGIWIHGRGTPLTSRGTRGCVALQNPDIHSLGSELALVKTPVIIGRKVQWTQDDISQNKVANTLKEEVRQWSSSWENKSDNFFSFYDPAKFNRSGQQKFSDFKSHKQDLFKTYPWIHVYLDKIYTLPGPGYWVTYFEQYFRSPMFSSEGLKRLYWQKIQGKWKIVGSEWRGGNWGQKQDYTRFVQKDIRFWLSNWKKAWEDADLKNYLGFYDPQARQDTRKGKKHIAAYKKQVWAEEKPAEVNLTDINIDLHSKGAKVVFNQVYKGQKGFQDKGRKTLILEPYKQTWQIVSEAWSAG